MAEERSPPERSPTAITIVRGPFLHDARVLRSARTLREAGYTPLVVAAVTASGLAHRGRTDGIAVVRVPRHRLIARLQARDAGTRAGGAAPAAGSASRRLALRAYRLARTLDFSLRATRLVLRERPVLLHCNDYSTMWVGVAAKVALGARVVYDAHELWPDRNGRFEWRPWLLVAEALFTRVADRVVTASPGYAEAMVRRYRIAPPAVVRNVPDPVARTRPATPDPGAPVGIYAGALLRGRGLEEAIDAAALVPGLRLRLLGPGLPDMLRSLRSRAEAAGIADRVEIPGPVPPDEVVPALAGATFGLNLIQPVCLSYELTLPNKLLEYVAAGVPVLSSDVPVSAAFVAGHGIGEVVPAADVPAIASGMRRMLDPALGAALRERVARLAPELTWTRESRVLRDAYAAATA